ncbi:MAG TPA: enoyl-CoA hydratase-related protein, partial [Nitrospiraceae bacterium]|nr:enoyl-CoA hydratase-related protein [Nitrospiraceae bacterium]
MQPMSASSNRGHKHFPTALLDEGILLVGFDYSGKAVNLLNQESLADWRDIIERVQQTVEITGVVLVSLKEANFCAGADLDEIRAVQRSGDFGAIDRLVTGVHHLFHEMARSSKPFVAAVEGPCLGGGLELALACHARLCSTHQKTCFALPEVRLGILPGFGGTQRLPRVVGLPAALDMITTGKRIFPRAALRMGLVDGMVASVPAAARTLDGVQNETLVQAAVEK